MSADAWSLCPACKKNHEKRLRDARSALDLAYGVVSLKKFKDMETQYQHMVESDGPDNNLREDYEFYIDPDGWSTADFHAGCTNCDFEFTFRHSEQVEV